mgnify:CR=1 FL=1
MRKTITLTIIITIIITSGIVFAANYTYDGRVEKDVKRDRIIAIGEDYKTLRYHVKSQNVDYTGYTGATCPDTTLGWREGMVYCWGGEDTTKQFLTRIHEDLDGAGNKWCSTPAGTTYDTYCAGTDCSGFVSNAWTSPRYYTSSWHNISDQLGDWAYLRMGDALNKAGSHIRLFDYFTDDTGTAIIYESTGFGWQMQHRSLPRDNDYVPVRYNDVGDNKVFPFDEPTITYIVRAGTERVEIRWDGEAETGFRLYQSTNGSSWDMIRDETELTPMLRTCDVSGMLPDTTYYFKMTSVDPGPAETGDSDVAAYRYDGYGWGVRTLLVDGADRYREQFSTNHDFMTRVGKAIGSTGLGFDFCSNEGVVDEQIDLTAYDAVVWITAEESTFDESFSWPEQMHLMDYLKSGGALFASGAEIGWDLDHRADWDYYKNGSPNDEFFYNSYLRSDFSNDQAGTYNVQGSSGSIFDGLSFSIDDETHGTYDVVYADVLTALYGATTGLTYQGGIGGIACVYDSSPSSGTVVYMGFPFETIYPESSRFDVMQAVMEYNDVPPEPPTIKTAKRSAADAVTVTWEGHADQGFLLSQKTGTGSWSVVQDETTLGSDSRSATVTGLSSLTRYAFKLQAKCDAGTSGDSDVMVCYLPLDNLGSAILIVDGYDRYNDKNGSNHTLLENFADSLDNYRYDSCANEAVADGTVLLGDYDVVMWMCGDESTESETFSATEQGLLETYLTAGGKLFVSGAEIGWDLVHRADTSNVYSNGDPNDSLFYRDYLQAEYDSDDAGTYQARGVSGTSFDGISLNFDDGTHGTYNVEYPDVLNTGGGSSAILYYGASGTSIAGVSFTGTFPGGAETAKVVYFGFPFETIYDQASRRNVMLAVLDSLGAVTCPVDLSVFSVE